MNKEFDDEHDRNESSNPELAGRIDAFPPGHVDLALVAEDLMRKGTVGLMRLKVEQVDRAVGRAMEQVPVPFGLDERLLAELQVGRKRFGRRRWLVYGPVAAALAAGVAGFWLRTAPTPMGYESVIAGVGDFHDQEPAAEGTPLDVVLPPGDYPCPPAVATNARTRWRIVRNLLRRAGMAYDLTNGQGKQATLYVVDLNSRTWPIEMASLQLSPPQGRFTVGRTIGAWKDGKRLYVLVVEGDQRDYLSFLRRQDSFA